MPPPGQLGAPYSELQMGTIIAFAITFAFASFLLALRYLQAFKIVKQVEPDLVILTISWGLALAYFLTMHKLMDHGWARHVYEIVNPLDFAKFNDLLLPNTLIYLITPAVTKMAMLVVLYKINPSLPYRITVAAIGIAIFGYTLTLTTLTGGPCSPKKGTETIKCLMNVATAQSILNIISDVAVILVPIPTIISLNLPPRQKMSVALILAVGSAVCVCSIARTPSVLRLETSTDMTHEEGILGVWSIVEVNLGIACGCGMRLKKLIVHYLPNLGLGSLRSRGKSTPYASSTWGNSVQRTKDAHGHTNPANLDADAANAPYQLHSIQKDGGGSTDKILS
ncbi:hypothetical protein QBC35DRAFT_513783 [Podospora australis]|uniref:Rhodopsin domain-containing protein n=1 Tax=Podospora australis TaxID=1536484 RepID=A0AAN6WXS9_9PEZI|nr:hypothetical protein QBC35DRAFT_513783 [Podospora australis]